jgi:hypothetical protein
MERFKSKQTDECLSSALRLTEDFLDSIRVVKGGFDNESDAHAYEFFAISQVIGLALMRQPFAIESEFVNETLSVVVPAVRMAKKMCEEKGVKFEPVMCSVESLK